MFGGGNLWPSEALVDESTCLLSIWCTLLIVLVIDVLQLHKYYLRERESGWMNQQYTYITSRNLSENTLLMAKS